MNARGKFSENIYYQEEDVDELASKLDRMQRRIIERIESRESHLSELIHALAQQINRLEESNLALVKTNNAILAKMDESSKVPREAMPSPMAHQSESESSMMHNSSMKSSLQQSDLMVKRQEEEEEEEERSELQIYYKCSIAETICSPRLLLGHLEERFKGMGLAFSECELIYEFPEMREVNFHDKIDRIKNILFVSELENGEIIGAFTHQAFNPEPKYIPELNPKAFICNLTKDTYIYAFKTNRTHYYDPKHLIFGNWEIKVKACEEYLETNWGTNGDSFLRKHFGEEEKVRNIKLEWLFGLGASGKKLRMKGYRIYRFK